MGLAESGFMIMKLCEKKRKQPPINKANKQEKNKRKHKHKNRTKKQTNKKKQSQTVNKW